MPKLKTHRGAAKRIRVTKSGKFKHAKAGRRHLLEWKPGRKNRSLRKPGYVHPADERRVRQILPYG